MSLSPKRIGVVSVALLAAGILWLARPLSSSGLESRAAPVATWEEGLRGLERLRREDGDGISPECRTRWMSHGRRTGRVIVLLHGLTNCPAQFDSLARLLFARGANVVIPRLPRHGRADRMTTELAKLEARELCAFTDRVLDVAGGLGDSVTVAGLSVGGAMSAWAGQQREDLDRAVLIAPLIRVPRAPDWSHALLTRLVLALPNRFVWWDGQRRERLLGPKHVYPRFATHAIGAALRIGSTTRRQAKRSPPGARDFAIVSVGGDDTIDRRTIAKLVRDWRRQGARHVSVYEFPRELRLNHDIVDPEQVGGNPAITYPRLVALIDP